MDRWPDCDVQVQNVEIMPQQAEKCYASVIYKFVSGTSEIFHVRV